eukprot:4635020-Prymnesium_polylepis.2
MTRPSLLQAARYGRAARPRPPDVRLQLARVFVWPTSRSCSPIKDPMCVCVTRLTWGRCRVSERR